MRNRGGLVFFVVLALSIFLPSSVAGTINYRMVGTWQLVCWGLLVLGVMWLHSAGVLRRAFGTALAIFALLLIATLSSPLTELALGASVAYLAMLLVLSLDLRAIVPGRLAIGAFAAICIALLVLAWGTVFEVEPVRQLLEDHYQMFSDELFEQMVGWYAKPVGVFATHSLASLAYFALAMVCFRLAHFARWGRRLFWLVLALAFVGLQFYLVSNTSMVFLAIIGLLALVYTVKTRRWITLALIIAAAGAGLFYVLDVERDALDHWVELVSLTLGSDSNGLRSRFSFDSRLGNTYEFMLSNPLRPVGFTYSQLISLGDNFIAEYILRMTVVGWGLYLWMLFHFLLVNLGPRWGRWFFAFFILADLAYPPLTATRFIFMVPVMVILWRFAPLLWPRPVRYRILRCPTVSPLVAPASVSA